MEERGVHLGVEDVARSDMREDAAAVHVVWLDVVEYLHHRLLVRLHVSVRVSVRVHVEEPRVRRGPRVLLRVLLQCMMLLLVLLRALPRRNHVRDG